MRTLRGKTGQSFAGLWGWLVGAGGAASSPDAQGMLGQGSGAVGRVYRCWDWLLCPTGPVLGVLGNSLQICLSQVCFPD